jgi:hypothetical protein
MVPRAHGREPNAPKRNTANAPLKRGTPTMLS